MTYNVFRGTLNPTHFGCFTYTCTSTACVSFKRAVTFGCDVGDDVMVTSRSVPAGAVIDNDDDNDAGTLTTFHSPVNLTRGEYPQWIHRAAYHNPARLRVCVCVCVRVCVRACVYQLLSDCEWPSRQPPTTACFSPAFSPISIDRDVDFGESEYFADEQGNGLVDFVDTSMRSQHRKVWLTPTMHAVFWMTVKCLCTVIPTYGTYRQLTRTEIPFPQVDSKASEQWWLSGR